jgi:hypothetical protein
MEEPMADNEQNEQHEPDELRDLDVPDEDDDDVNGGNVARSGSDISPWTTTHGGHVGH